uniref:non-specific serine/threonine protein kinase n=1 Tax=Sparus aurata TaxID=8175 RepID=A0A671WZB2_SPAAU
MGQTLCMCSRGSITIDNKTYYFVQKLDEGGFSFVDLVEGAKDGRFYALKKILCHDREGRQEAQTEVEMHQTFNHPNILNLVAHTFVDRGGKSEAWLLLPYMRQKGSLWSVLERLRDKGSSMPEKQILQILRGICSGLKNMHEKGFAHRDLKPTNVLLDEDDRPVLMDLGSMNRARIEVRGSREAMTIQDWAAQRCTISYRAPELFNVESHCIIDERTDIWVKSSATLMSACLMHSYSQGLQMLLSSIMVSNPQERPNINWVLDQVQDLQSRSPNTQTNMV